MNDLSLLSFSPEKLRIALDGKRVELFIWRKEEDYRYDQTLERWRWDEMNNSPLLGDWVPIRFNSSQSERKSNPKDGSSLHLLSRANNGLARCCHIPSLHLSISIGRCFFSHLFCSLLLFFIYQMFVRSSLFCCLLLLLSLSSLRLDSTFRWYSNYPWLIWSELFMWTFPHVSHWKKQRSKFFFFHFPMRMERWARISLRI